MKAIGQINKKEVEIASTSFTNRLKIVKINNQDFVLI